MTKLIAFAILFILVGAILVIIGHTLWKKQKFTLIHVITIPKLKLKI